MSAILRNLESRKNRALAAIRACERKMQDIELERERARGEVSAFEDAIAEVQKCMDAKKQSA